MKKTETKTTYTCDICGTESGPVGTLRIPVRYHQEFTTDIVLKVSGESPYAFSNGDVCKTCLQKAMRSYLDKQAKDKLKLVDRIKVGYLV